MKPGIHWTLSGAADSVVGEVFAAGAAVLVVLALGAADLLDELHAPSRTTHMSAAIEPPR
jgi:hypothetical protein